MTKYSTASALLLSMATIATLIAGCKNQKTAAAAGVQAPPAIIEDGVFRKMMTDKALYAAVTEIIALDTAFISKDTLHIYTRKVQACESENFSLLTSGSLLKSMPPQANVRLFLLNDPSCKETNRFHLTYNISSLRLKQDSIAVTNTIIRLGNWKQPLNYNY